MKRLDNRMLCTTIRSRLGDSGGPVYYPGEDGFTRAMGVLGGGIGRPPRMRYEPVDTALQQLNTTLLTGP